MNGDASMIMLLCTNFIQDEKNEKIQYNFIGSGDVYFWNNRYFSKIYSVAVQHSRCFKRIHRNAFSSFGACPEKRETFLKSNSDQYAFSGFIRSISLTPFLCVMLLVVGIVHTGVAYALYFGSMEHLEAQTIAIFSYIDPIVAILLSALFLHESMGMMEMIGAVLVLCATFISEL